MIRKNIYSEWVVLTEKIKDLENKKMSAKEKADKIFEEFKSNVELAYEKADEAGWILCDELDDEIKILEEKSKSLFKFLQENQFDLSDFQSCCAYGLSIKKPVKVIFLDGKEVCGLIYPLIYDNPQEMILCTEDGEEYYLDEGWEVDSVTEL